MIMNYASLDLKKTMRSNDFVRHAWSYSDTSHVRDKEIRESLDFVARIDDLAHHRKVLELCSGHGLIGQLLGIKDTVSVRQACLTDCKSRGFLEGYFNNYGKVLFDQIDILKEHDEILAWDFGLVIAMHACGNLTDAAIDIAIEKGADIAICPCCYHKAKVARQMASLARAIGKPMACDSFRLARMAAAGYNVTLRKLNISISPCNNILIGVKEARRQ